MGKYSHAWEDHELWTSCTKRTYTFGSVTTSVQAVTGGGTCASNGLHAITDYAECAAAGAAASNLDEYHVADEVNTADRVHGCGMNEDLPSGKSRIEFYGSKGNRVDCGYRGYSCLCKPPSAGSALLQVEKKAASPPLMDCPAGWTARAGKPGGLPMSYTVRADAYAACSNDPTCCAVSETSHEPNDAYDTHYRLGACEWVESENPKYSHAWEDHELWTSCTKRTYTFGSVTTSVQAVTGGGTCASNGLQAITDYAECAAAGAAASNLDEYHVADEVNTADRVHGCGMNENLPSGKSRIEFYGSKGNRVDCGYRGYSCLCKPPSAGSALLQVEKKAASPPLMDCPAGWTARAGKPGGLPMSYTHRADAYEACTNNPTCCAVSETSHE